MNHEKLRCYRQLIEVARDLSKEAAKWPRGHGPLADQLRRAMTSAVLTLCEGNAKRSSRAERRRFFEMSLGSIAEVAAAVDLVEVFGLISIGMRDHVKSRLKLAYVQIRALE